LSALVLCVLENADRFLDSSHGWGHFIFPSLEWARWGDSHSSDFPLPSYVIWFLDASHGWGYFIFPPRIESGEAILAFWVISPLLSYVTPVDLSVLHEFCDYLTLFLMMLVVIFHLTQLSFSARIYVFWMCRFMCLLWFVASFPPG